MSLCPHGYTANWDCPVCPCACGSGTPAGACLCETITVVDGPHRIQLTAADPSIYLVPPAKS